MESIKVFSKYFFSFTQAHAVKNQTHSMEIEE